jgi:hypothetical protein
MITSEVGVNFNIDKENLLQNINLYNNFLNDNNLNYKCSINYKF